MLEELANLDLDEMWIRDRIHACVKTRLAMNAEHKEAMRRLLSFLALPQNAALMSKMRSCSEMWQPPATPLPIGTITRNAAC